MDPNPSSPRSTSTATTKLRLMCSYGGHIIPRPHDSSLCYVGGDTRIVLVDRHSSLSDLHSRLSHTLLNARPFTLKYQLPSEDLDSLISLATDEDLDNMIDEYDRTSAPSPSPSPSPSRLRLFLFPSKPETAASMGSLLHDSKSETWFVDALNGTAALLDRGLSADTLLNLELGMLNISSQVQHPPDQSSLPSKMQQLVPETSAQDAVLLDSPPLVETTSSFGSTSSSPSVPVPIKVRIEPEDYQTTTVPVASAGEDNLNRLTSEDDHGTVGMSVSLMRKPPLPLQPEQRKLLDIHSLPSPDSKHAGGYNLPSPDSVASDCSITSAGSLAKNTIYQDAAAAQLVNRENRAPTPAIDQEQTTNCQLPPPQYQPVAGGTLIHHPAGSNKHYNQHPAAAVHVHVPAISSSYYSPAAAPMYLLHSNQQQAAGDPQYPNMCTTSQPAYYDPTTMPPRPVNMTPNYNMDPLPPIYTTKPAEMTGTGTGTGTAPLLVHHQFQQPYIGISQMPPPAQSNVVAADPAPYGYDPYAHHHRQNMQQQADHHLVYYGQHVAPQYQTMTQAAAAAAVMLSQQASTHQHQFPPPNSDATSTTAQQ